MVNKMGMPYLEPCPKCGGEAGVFPRFDAPEEKWTVGCLKCGIEMPMESTLFDAAVMMWNKRIMLDLWRRMTPDDPGHHITVENEGEHE